MLFLVGPAALQLLLGLLASFPFPLHFLSFCSMAVATLGPAFSFKRPCCAITPARAPSHVSALGRKRTFQGTEGAVRRRCRTMRPYATGIGVCTMNRLN